MRSDDLYALPPDLPVPEDDGACAHLPGLAVPPIALRATSGDLVRLDRSPARWTVVYAYPRTGVPDQSSPPGWDAIPGARGCTPQTCTYRDHHREMASAGPVGIGPSPRA
jgi:peroxiredoxin